MGTIAQIGRLAGMRRLAAVAVAAWLGLAPAAAPAAEEPALFDAVTVTELVLPPVAGAGCLAAGGGGPGCLVAGGDSVELGGFLPGGRALVLRVRLAGQGANGRHGDELVLLRPDAPAGSAIRCLTCGLPAAAAAALPEGRLDAPQPFADGQRLLAGMAVLDCAPFALDDDRCTARSLRVRPLKPRWPADPDLRIGQLRLHPGGRHVGFGIARADGAPVRFAWVAALVPDEDGYALTSPQLLFRSGADVRLVRPGRRPGTLVIDPAAIEIEELAGFTPDGREILYRGFPWESGRPDLFAVDVASGAVRRVTDRAGGRGPVAISPDGQWLALGDAWASGLRLSLAGMAGLPPLTDLVTAGTTPALEAAERRVRDLVLLDRTGQRAGMPGRMLHSASTGWSIAGEPAWSPDGRAIAALQLATGSVTQRGGRFLRLVLLRFAGRAPAVPMEAVPLPDAIGWATLAPPAFDPGDRAPIPAGRYSLEGQPRGEVRVVVSRTPDGSALSGIAVRYRKFASGTGGPVTGEEAASISGESLRLTANLAQAGEPPVRKLTGPDGYVVTSDPLSGTAQARGLMVTTIGEQTWRAPETAR